MKRTKLLSKVLISLMIVITIFGLVSSSRAGIPPIVIQYFQYNDIGVGWWTEYTEIPDDELSQFHVGIGATEEEIESGLFPKLPFDMKLFIDDDEIPLRRFQFYDKDGSIHGIPGVHWWYFYQVFKPGYFNEGNHTVRIEIWIQKPYGGSEVYGWRIFINYIGPPEYYGPIGELNIASHTLHVY